MKQKKFLSLCASAVCAATLACTANAQFEKITPYTPGTFTDVAESSWYSKEVTSAYELGFMNGTSDTLFTPGGNVTVAQGITVASRIHAIYNNKAIPENSTDGNWYDSFVKYALDNKIIENDSFDSYTRNIKRFEMAELFYNAMGKDYFVKVNDVKSIPDVKNTAPYAEKLLTLYNAGIVMGSDEYGTFNPDNNILRSESAAIINRVALPENRIKGTLKVNNEKEAYLLCFTESFNEKYEGAASGWHLDNQGGPVRASVSGTYGELNDVSEEFGTSLTKQLNTITEGTVTLETSVSTDENGVSLEFVDEKANKTFSLYLEDNSWKVHTPEGEKTALANAFGGEKTSYTFRITLNLDNKTCKIVINDKDCGSFSLCSNEITAFRFATTEKSKAILVPGNVYMTANYAAYEGFSYFGTDSVYGWSTDGEVAVTDGELVLGSGGMAQKTFEKIADHKIIAETYFMLPEGENASITLSEDDKTAVKLEIKDLKLIANGKSLGEVKSNMWNRLRIETNASTASANILVNGRLAGTASLNASSKANKLTFTSEGDAKFDNIKVYEKVDTPDYAPVPQYKASADDYLVGVNVCSLWQEGQHYGWGVISPYDDHRPVLGYYDEGNPETADWEINYMVNHGIDFQAICWYADVSEGPIKDPTLSEQLHEGYMYADYSDYMNYIIMWEAGSGKKFNAEQFRNHVVPYWFENYFLDDRYLKIDNQLVISIWNAHRLYTGEYFGDIEGCKAELDYLEETAKNYGFDGVLFWYNGSAGDNHALAGFDACHAYHWQEAGKTYEANVNNILNSAKTTSVYTIPTVSVGFSNLPWGGIKHGNMTVEDYARTNEWVTSTYLPQYSDAHTWSKNIVMLSTWNEYGEGTYISPSGLNGFGYLDVIRDTYTDYDKEHTDYIPDEKQAKRIARMFDESHRLLRKEGLIGNERAELVPAKTVVLGKDTVAECGNIDNVVYLEDGGISGTSMSDNKDPLFRLDASLLTFNPDDVPIIEVTMQAPAGTNVEMFFITLFDNAWNGSKSISFRTDSDEMKTYTVNIKNNLWAKNVAGFRIDPTNAFDTAFTVKSISFMTSAGATDSSLFINGVEVDNSLKSVTQGIDTLHPFDPKTGVEFMLNSVYDWNKQSGTLTINANHHTVTYVAGSDKYTVDGTEKNLGYETPLRDSIPMICFKTLAEALEYKCEEKDGDFYIETNEADVFDEINERREGAWEFNGSDSEGWSTNAMSVLVKDGLMTLTSVTDSQDPVVQFNNPLALKTAKYSGIEIKARYSFENSSNTPKTMQIYFVTDNDPKWGEDKCLRISHQSMSSGSEFVTYTYDLTKHDKWKGKVTDLRFDPFDGIGTMEVDYIRFIEVEGYLAEEEVPVTSTIVNGDAEGEEIEFYSTNAKISIVQDPLNENNRVYLFEGDANKKQWTYARHKFNFKAGYQYKIEYDVMVSKDRVGNAEVITRNNLRYPDIGVQNNMEHITGSVKALPGVWQHYEKVYTVKKVDLDDGHEFTVFGEPLGDISLTFYLDNIKVTEIPPEA